MRVLLTAHGGYGHVLPLVGLGGALVGDGHDVLLATGADLCPVVESRGLAAVAAGLTDAGAVAEARRRWPDVDSLPPGAWTPRMFAEIAAPAMVAALGPLIEEWRPDVVVREEGEHGGAVAAAAAGIPWVTLGWGSPLPEVSALAALGRLLAPLWVSAGLVVPHRAAFYGAAVIDPCPPSLYAQRPDVSPRYAVRLRPAPTSSSPPPSDGRRAYVGFGTVPLFQDAGLARRAVLALRDLGFEVIVSGAVDDLEDEHVHAARWVELDELLPSCSVVVCHGGAGTVLASLAAGVPLVLVPRGAPSQQRMTAACVVRGVGRAADLSSLPQVLESVISDDRFRAAAGDVAREIAEMPGPATVAAVLGHVAATRG